MGVIENRIDITELERSGGGGGGGTAASVSYDNTTSHMAATDVQAALDELNLDIVEGLALVNTSVAANREAIIGTQTMIAPIEEVSTSSAAYSVGDQLIYNGLLYKVTASIAIGDTITPGTNVTLADDLTKQISGYKFNGVQRFNESSDGTSTVTQVLASLIGKVKTYLTANPDSIVIPDSLVYGQHTITLSAINAELLSSDNIDSRYLYFSGSLLDTSELSMFSVNYRSSSNPWVTQYAKLDGTSYTRTAEASLVATGNYSILVLEYVRM